MDRDTVARHAAAAIPVAEEERWGGGEESDSGNVGLGFESAPEGYGASSSSAASFISPAPAGTANLAATGLRTLNEANAAREALVAPVGYEKMQSPVGTRRLDTIGVAWLWGCPCEKTNSAGKVEKIWICLASSGCTKSISFTA
jgi:hypothetical protein